MSDQRPTNQTDRAAAYVDGALEPELARAFEREMEASQSLRAEVEAMRRVDESLRRSFGSLEALEPDLSAPPIRADRGQRLRLAGAAILAAAAVIVLTVSAWPTLFPAKRQGFRYQNIAQVYREYERRGWPIEWVCEDDVEFAQATADGVGLALVVEPQPDVELSGWTYSDYLTDIGLDSRAMILITEVAGDEALVIVQRGAGPEIRRSGSRDLRVFRREVDGVTLYEVTPAEEARVIPRFRRAPELLPES